MKTHYFKSANEWKKWLSENHSTETELWLVYYKKHTKQPSIPYDDSVKIALCWGWIDGLVKKLDDVSYARRFTPRRNNSVWSESNKKRVTELIKSGKIQKPGLEKIEIAKQNGSWNKVIKVPEIDTSMDNEFQEVLLKNKLAHTYFYSLSKTNQNQFLIWINMGKRKETREKRITESLKLLNTGKKLGLK